jgi:hypothetical protein
VHKPSEQVAVNALTQEVVPFRLGEVWGPSVPNMEAHAGLLDISTRDGKHPLEAHEARGRPPAPHRELVGALEADELREDALVLSCLIEQVVRTDVAAQGLMLGRPPLDAMLGQ